MPPSATEAADEVQPYKPKPYKPKPSQLKNQLKDRRDIDRDLLYRNRFEPAWKHNVDKWNLVAPPGLEGTPNYVVPVSRMATHTGIVSMRQDLPDIVPVPEGEDEKKLSYVLKEASAHVHRMCNMEGVMDQGIVDFAVLGNMVLESFVQVPFTGKRVPVLGKGGEPTGEFEMVYKRDWSRPKIGTRSRSPWECAFDSGARIPSQVRRCWFQDRISREEFEEQYVNKPEHDYINLDCVPDGAVYTFNEGGDLVREEVEHDKIVIDNVQNELTDSWRKYANGVLIWDVPLSSVHAHGKITLSLVPNHHKYDTNKKTHALYGCGDPELLSDLDDLINAATNMFILNYRQKNTYVPSIEGAADVGEIDFTSGQPIKGKVTIQSLGQADLPEWEAFKTNLEEWAIQMVKKNYRRLEGEVAKTAYEAAQKKGDENKGMEYQIKRMEAGGLLEYARKHMSDIMEHLTVAEWCDVLDEDVKTVREMLRSGQLGDADVIFGKGKRRPLKVRYAEQIRTRGKVFREGYDKKGNRSLDQLQEVKELRGQDGWLTASEEYLHTKAWRLFKKVPDVYLVGKTILGQDDLIELGKIEQVIQHLTNLVSLQSMEKQAAISLGLDYDKVQNQIFDAIGKRREDFTSTPGDRKIADTQAAIKKAKERKALLLNPQALQAAVQGGAPLPGPGPAPQAAPAVDPLAAPLPPGGAGPAR